MKTRFKVATIVGTRPELIKLSRVIPKLDSLFEHSLIHTGQNYDYELNEVFFKELEIRKPDSFLSVAGNNLAETIGNIIVRADQELERLKPDAILVYGDTNSCLSVIPAKRRRIPVFHMEAGNRCFDERVPEELNRKVVDHLSDINMTLTEHARRYLLREGLPAERTFCIGSCMGEVLGYYKEKIDTSQVLETQDLKEQKYFIVSAHREENVDREDKLIALVQSLKALAENHQEPILVSLHPRTQKKLEASGIKFDHPLIRSMKPFGFFDYVKLQQMAKCVISDSGTLTEESGYLGFPGVMIRDAHERPEGMDLGTAVMSDLKPRDLIFAVDLAIATNAKGRCPVDYEKVAKVSDTVARIIGSYIPFVRRTVWKEL
jgi:UDP-N-acetylglucosamine 2-epimerase